MAHFRKPAHVDSHPPHSDDNIKALLNQRHADGLHRSDAPHPATPVVETRGVVPPAKTPELSDDTPTILNKTQFEALRKSRANARRAKKEKANVNHR